MTLSTTASRSPKRSGRPSCNFCECGDHAWAPLTKGFVALVDTADAHHLMAGNWSAAQRGKSKVVTYASRQIGGRLHRQTLLLHREVINAADGVSVDHANRSGTDNRRRNLRVCAQTDNNANARLRSDNQTGFKGVCMKRLGGPFMAYIGSGSGREYLGNYPTPEEAARAYNKAAASRFGEFALLNEIAP